MHSKAQVYDTKPYRYMNGAVTPAKTMSVMMGHLVTQ